MGMFLAFFKFKQSQTNPHVEDKISHVPQLIQM